MRKEIEKQIVTGRPLQTLGIFLLLVQFISTSILLFRTIVFVMKTQNANIMQQEKQYTFFQKQG